MYFKIDKKILNTDNTIYTAVVYVTGIDNKKENPVISKMLQDEINCVYTELSNRNINELKELNEYRIKFREFGINPSKYPCSVESIIKRIVKKREFPILSSIVNLCNYISIKYLVPVGVHDTDTLVDNLYLRLATIKDCGVKENNIDDDKLTIGEIIYATGNSVRTRYWLWRQTPIARVTEKSENFIITIDGFESNREAIDSASKELVKLIKQHFNTDAISGIVNSKKPKFYFEKINEEEIENQITIMLKGVAQHTSISEIRSKIITCYKEKKPLRVKLGLDPSAPDIHIGHAVVLRKIKQLQDLGHIAVIIIGDYTGMIGDPTGKSKTRNQLSREDVKKNATTYMEQIFKIIDRKKTGIHFNSEWLSRRNFKDIIELASKCTVARMLEREDFYNRYTNHLPLSLHEFFYPLMQAYDSVAIRADIELGGTDQTFNILMGRNIQRDYGQKPQLTLFMPLLEGIDGVEKMSKSLHNYVGISEEASIIYEKIMKIPDNKIIKYFNLCTDIHPIKVKEYQDMLDRGINPRDIKMKLAYAISELYTGKKNADIAENRFKSIFQNNQIPEDVPKIRIEKNFNNIIGEEIIIALVKNKYFKSKSEVRRLLVQGGIRLNGEKINDINLFNSVKTGDILKIGKNKFFELDIL